jgi:hypothetical protein
MQIKKYLKINGRKTMTKFRLIAILLLLALALATWSWKQMFLQEIPIKYVCEIDVINTLPFIKYPNKSHYIWFMITSRPQYENWLKEDLKLPPNDFSESYLIISKYKIDGLYFSPKYVDNCVGAPPGFIDFDRGQSTAHKAYIYKMPKIILTQALG